MQGPTDEASVPTKYVIDKRMLGATQRRKIGTRTMPVPAEALPVAKRPRLQASTGICTGVDELTTDPHDDTPTVLVNPAAFLPSTTASRAPRRNWNGEEDAKLIEAVKKHGKDWSLVAAMVPGRTNVQCRMRWVVVDILDPANRKNGKTRVCWKPEEDTKLAEAVKKHGTDWVKVAEMVPGRMNHQCRTRWVDTLDSTIGKSAGKWAPEEDIKLTEAVIKYGADWVAVAAMVPGRSNHQCRTRWVDTLDSTIGKSAGYGHQKKTQS
jgi:phage gp37-like protein